MTYRGAENAVTKAARGAVTSARPSTNSGQPLASTRAHPQRGVYRKSPTLPPVSGRSLSHSPSLRFWAAWPLPWLLDAGDGATRTTSPRPPGPAPSGCGAGMHWALGAAECAWSSREHPSPRAPALCRRSAARSRAVVSVISSLAASSQCGSRSPKMAEEDGSLVSPGCTGGPSSLRPTSPETPNHRPDTGLQGGPAGEYRLDGRDLLVSSPATSPHFPVPVGESNTVPFLARWNGRAHHNRSEHSGRS